jgi:hypothetical protein
MEPRIFIETSWTFYSTPERKNLARVSRFLARADLAPPAACARRPADIAQFARSSRPRLARHF